jgi:hypothetical protein
VDRPRHFVIRSERQRANAAACCLEAPEGWEVIIRPHKSKRSLQQNACLWAMLTAAADELGYTPTELHELAKAERFGTREVYIPDGSGRSVRIIKGSTTKLNVEEMSRYLDWLQVWVTENVGVDARSIRRAYGE